MQQFNAFLIKSFFILSFFLFQSQIISAQSVMDKIVKQTCDEMNELDENLSPKEVNAKMELVMGTMLISNYKDLEKEYGITMENIENEDPVFDEFSQKLAMQLIVECPKFLEILTLIEEERSDDEAPVSQTIEGKFIGIEGDDFIFVTIKDSNGKTQKLFWGASFSGDGELMNAKKLKGKSVVVSYTEKECYNAKLKDYSILREITSLEVK